MQEVDSSSLFVSTKKFDKFRLVEFFYPLRKQWYIITTQSWISSPKVYIISRRLYLLSQWWYTRLSPWWYTKLRFDDIHGFAVIKTRQFKIKQKRRKYPFFSPSQKTRQTKRSAFFFVVEEIWTLSHRVTGKGIESERARWAIKRGRDGRKQGERGVRNREHATYD